MSRRTAIQVNQENLEHNLSLVKQMAPGCQITAMVKANAYGCGYQEVLPVLDGRVAALGVACLNEALVIRDMGYKTPCILFQGVFSSQDFPLIDEYGFDLVIHSEQQLKQFLSYPFRRRIRCWLKIDTGMNRLGVLIDEAPNAIKRLVSCSNVDRPIGVLTHYACADEPDHPLNGYQNDQFRSIQTMLGPEFIYSIANSAGIVSKTADYYDMVRPGIMLYGGSPLLGRMASEIGLKPVSFFYTQIIAIKTVAKDDSVGYGGVWRAPKVSKIALIAAGYGDGYPRHINGDAHVSINNQIAPIVGRVSMDMMAINISKLTNVNIGDSVELWGSQILVDQVASWAGTISYELFCQFKPRVEPS